MECSTRYQKYIDKLFSKQFSLRIYFEICLSDFFKRIFVSQYNDIGVPFLSKFILISDCIVIFF